MTERTFQAVLETNPSRTKRKKFSSVGKLSAGQGGCSNIDVGCRLERTQYQLIKERFLSNINVSTHLSLFFQGCFFQYLKGQLLRYIVIPEHFGQVQFLNRRIFFSVFLGGWVDRMEFRNDVGREVKVYRDPLLEI